MHVHHETCTIDIYYACKSARVLPEVTNNRGQAERQRFMPRRRLLHQTRRVSSLYIIHADSIDAFKSVRSMPGATNKRGQADGQRFMLVGAICTRYSECHVHVLHTSGHSKSTWRAKLTTWCNVHGNADACLRDGRMGMASSCGVSCAIGALVSFLSIPCLFLFLYLPSHLPDLLPRA